MQDKNTWELRNVRKRMPFEKLIQWKVWSPSHFDSVGLSQSMWFFLLTHNIVCIWSSGSNAQGEIEGPWRVPCQLKSPSRVQDRDEGFPWRLEREKCPLRWGIIDLPSIQINIFLQKANRKKSVSGPTCSKSNVLWATKLLQNALFHKLLHLYAFKRLKYCGVSYIKGIREFAM